VTKVIVDSIHETTAEAVARRLAESPKACALVELRADDLRAGDVSGLVARAGRPVVVTVRTEEDGGSFDGSTEEKRLILDAALAAGCAFIDVEWNGPLRAAAFDAHAPRTILSHHGGPCDAASLGPLFGAMAETRASRLKIVPRATRPTELRTIRDLLARAQGARRELCAFASGAAGSWSRVLAPTWGAWGVYGAAVRGRETGAGQFETRELLDVYRVLELSPATQFYGLCGTPLQGSPSPAMHAAAYRALGMDAVYVPVDTADFDEIVSIVPENGLLPLRGFGVTIPLKERAARHCGTLDAYSACGSVNTVCVESGRWEGWNTDAPAALALTRKHLDPKGIAVAVVGAGGTARAIGAAFKEAGAGVTLYARDVARGAETARAIGVDAAPWAALPSAFWEILVQATPLGRRGEELLLRRHLNGRVVLDVAYGAEPTPLVKAARARGLAVVDGFALLVAQATLQFERLTGQPAPEGVMAAALQSRLSSPSA
jgi:3-dehydroquinate dehydratase / shikimate dehydrogenase